MSLLPALEALELARTALCPDEDPQGRDAALTTVLRVLVLNVAQGRGRLREVEGALDQLRRGGDRWRRLHTVCARVHARRGGQLFAPGPFESTLRLDDGVMGQLHEALAGYREADLEQLGGVYEAARSRAQRRRQSTHYTPPELAAQIVARSFEPLLSSRAPAQLRVCDPAMGAGAFVLAACRWIGERIGPRGRLQAALNCVFGVDEDPGAVALAKLCLWFECEAEALPWTCFDHGLRRGDALVGLEPEQLCQGHWIPARGSADEAVHRAVEAARLQAEQLRNGFEALASDVEPEAVVARASLMANFADQSGALEQRANGLLAAFFASTKVREREQARRAWLAGSTTQAPHPQPRACHWWLAFPQLGAARFDAVVGNPPFLGKNGLLAQRGRAYLDWLKLLHEGSHGNADYAAHFFRRAETLVADSGTIGLVSTNTIAQGDTRTTGLAPMVAKGWEIHAVEEHLEWPGAANVTVSVVHLARAEAAEGLKKYLSGRRVDAIDSRLQAGPERPDPARLPANRPLAFIGTYVLGKGFVLGAEEREVLIAARASNADRIRPYLGGERLNASPIQASARWAIDFGELSLAQAGRWPELLERIRVEVKPQRDRLADNPDGRRRRRYWWRHGRTTPSLEAAVGPLSRCIVTSLVSKHLTFALVSARQLFSHKLCVFPIESAAAFGLLQSRIHGIWAWRHSSTMRNAGINYSPSDCFETFALPALEDAKLEQAGRRLHEARAAAMLDMDVGLTKTYNALADGRCNAPQILALRELHVALDHAALAAYGWESVEVPAYLERSERFEGAVLDRLYALNAERVRGSKGSP